jgi:hypothetical protein
MIRAAQKDRDARQRKLDEQIRRFTWQHRHPLGEYLVMAIPFIALSWWIAIPPLFDDNYLLRHDLRHFYMTWGVYLTIAFIVGSWLFFWYGLFRISEEDYSGLKSVRTKWKGRRVLIALTGLNLALSLVGFVEYFGRFIIGWATMLLQ